MRNTNFCIQENMSTFSEKKTQNNKTKFDSIFYKDQKSFILVFH